MGGKRVIPGSLLQLGIDVGGTFTDIALLDASTGAVRTEKVLTTPVDPSQGILEGVRRLQSKRIDLRPVTAVIHGTTLVSNALIERRGSKAALLTTRGFRDILLLGRELRYDVYDPNLVFPEPLIPRRLRRELNERIASDGRVIAELDRDHTREVVRALVLEGVEAIGVCLLHSYTNPIHEEIVAEIVREEAGDLPVSLSHEVLPQIREYERSSATAINAYVQPIMQHYLRRLRDGLHAAEVGGEVYLMTSSGGTIALETATKFPIHVLESGPAAGTLIASHIGREVGAIDVVSFDMGGTTAKSCVIRGGRPLIDKSHEVARVRRFKRGSGLPVGVPVTYLLEVGAGGGSIAEIDDLGLLRVGPRSAGADPGPVCYGRGGVEPTVTDANVVLGLINPDYFLGGELKLDAQAAARVIDERIGRPLGLDVQEAAAAINRLVTETMTEAARVHSVEMNVDIRRFALLAFGGAGPIHACGLARRLKLPAVICPPEAGVLSAVGLLRAPLAFEYARSYVADLSSLDEDTVTAILDSLKDEGRTLLERAGVAEVKFDCSVDMCYVGQGFELTTPIPCANGDLPRLKRIFDDTYEQAYGRRLDQLPARCVTWRVLASGPEPKFERQARHHSKSDGESLKGERAVYFPEDGLATCAVYDRERLTIGSRILGPAIIEETASTVPVPRGMEAKVDHHFNLVLKRVEDDPN